MSLVTYLFAFEGVKSFFIFRKTLCFLTSEFCKILLWKRYKKVRTLTRDEHTKIAEAGINYVDKEISYEKLL